MLVERLVNPKNILSSPHVIHEKQSLASIASDTLPPIKVSFSAVKFLIKTQKVS